MLSLMLTEEISRQELPMRSRPCFRQCPSEYQFRVRTLCTWTQQLSKRRVCFSDVVLIANPRKQRCEVPVVARIVKFWIPPTRRFSSSNEDAWGGKMLCTSTGAPRIADSAGRDSQDRSLCRPCFTLVVFACPSAFSVAMHI